MGFKPNQLTNNETHNLHFRGYNPYFEGLKPSFFMVLGSKGSLSHTLRIDMEPEGYFIDGANERIFFMYTPRKFKRNQKRTSLPWNMKISINMTNIKWSPLQKNTGSRGLGIHFPWNKEVVCCFFQPTTVNFEVKHLASGLQIVGSTNSTYINKYIYILYSGDSWMYSYQCTPMGNPYINRPI